MCDLPNGYILTKLPYQLKADILASMGGREDGRGSPDAWFQVRYKIPLPAPKRQFWQGILPAPSTPTYGLAFVVEGGVKIDADVDVGDTGLIKVLCLPQQTSHQKQAIGNLVDTFTRMARGAES